jgi:hypothetical protein
MDRVSSADQRSSEQLDPVVEEALKDLQRFVYRRRRIYNLRLERRDKSMKDPGARAGAVHIFKHLRHHGYSFPPELVRTWALGHGWKPDDADALSEYAAGVAGGTRYHTQPDPFGRHAIIRWRESALQR